jgi:CVNH domain
MIKLFSKSSRLGVSAVTLGLGLLASTTTFSPPAQAVEASSYQSSCRNIRISGDLLSANCRTRAGDYKDTNIRVRGIENNDGNLKFVGLGVSSSYQRSCQNIGVAGATLTASCRRINGTYNNRAAILIPGIKNIDGNLTY